MCSKEELFFDEETCRMCMAPGSGCIKIMSSINVKSGRIFDMIKFCYGLEITVHEYLPQLICNECALHLNVAFNLKKSYLNTEKCFLQYLQKESNKDVKPNLLKGFQENVIDQQVTHTVNQKGNLGGSTENDQKMMFASMNTYQSNQGQILECFEADKKFTRPNLMAYFGNNTIVELSDTETDTDSEANKDEMKTDEPIKTNNYECPICPEKYTNAFDYSIHVKNHTEKKCKVCGRVCKNMQIITAHFNSHSNGKLLKCPQCSYSTYLNSTLSLHIKRNHTDTDTKLYERKLYLNEHTNISQLATHLNDSHQELVETPTQVMDQPIITSEKKTYSCSICNRNLKSQHKLTVHLRLHQNNKLKFCYICNASFMKNMFLHFKQSHPGLPPYKCLTHCNLTFRTLKELEMHNKANKLNVSNIDALMQEKNTNDFSNLATTVTDTIYNGKDNFECYVCDSTFISLSLLEKHVKHHYVKKCKYCKRIFSSLRALTSHANFTHQKKEDGKQKFDCVQCGKSFGNFFSLKMHQNVHVK